MDSACKEDSEEGEMFVQGSDVSSQANIQTKENSKVKKIKTKKIGWDKENSIFYFKEE